MAVDFTIVAKTGGIKINRSYDVGITPYGQGSEERRLLSEGELVSIDVTTPPLSPDEYEDLKEFYDGEVGPLGTFTIYDPGLATPTEMTVRFDGPIGISEMSGGLFYECQYRLVKVRG
ncbi:MAG: hypothetical protein V2A34_06615 [Lentisphaerota bacterium]